MLLFPLAYSKLRRWAQGTSSEREAEIHNERRLEKHCGPGYRDDRYMPKMAFCKSSMEPKTIRTKVFSPNILPNTLSVEEAKYKTDVCKQLLESQMIAEQRPELQMSVSQLCPRSFISALPRELWRIKPPCILAMARLGRRGAADSKMAHI